MQLQCRRGPRMHESIAKGTGTLNVRRKCFESGDLRSETGSRHSRRVKMSTGRAEREVDEEREVPELRLRCRRRRPGRATGKHQKQRKGKKRRASGHDKKKLRASTAYKRRFQLRHRFQNGTRAV